MLRYVDFVLGLSEPSRSFSPFLSCMLSPGSPWRDGIDFCSVCFRFGLMFSLWPSHFLTINSLLMRAAAQQIVSRLFSRGWGRSAPYQEVGRLEADGFHFLCCLPLKPAVSLWSFFYLYRVRWCESVPLEIRPHDPEHFLIPWTAAAFSRSFCHKEHFLIFQ